MNDPFDGDRDEFFRRWAMAAGMEEVPLEDGRVSWKPLAGQVWPGEIAVRSLIRLVGLSAVLEALTAVRSRGFRADSRDVGMLYAMCYNLVRERDIRGLDLYATANQYPRPSRGPWEGHPWHLVAGERE